MSHKITLLFKTSGHAITLQPYLSYISKGVAASCVQTYGLACGPTTVFYTDLLVPRPSGP